MLLDAVKVWFWFGTLYLFWLVYQDYKNKRMVDDRKNSFMMGFSLAVIMVTDTGILYNLGIILTSIIFIMIMKKIKDIGQADINSIGWILLGGGLFSWVIALYFAAIFTIISIMFIVLKNYVFKYKAPLQFYGVLFLSYVCTGLLIRAY